MILKKIRGIFTNPFDRDASKIEKFVILCLFQGIPLDRRAQKLQNVVFFSPNVVNTCGKRSIEKHLKIVESSQQR